MAPKKKIPRGMIRNPETGRLVKRTGRIGQKLLLRKKKKKSAAAPKKKKRLVVRKKLVGKKSYYGLMYFDARGGMFNHGIVKYVSGTSLKGVKDKAWKKAPKQAVYLRVKHEAKREKYYKIGADSLRLVSPPKSWY
jgi:hypothetical protein